MSRFVRLVTKLTLYSRADCHLCHTMREVVTRVACALPEIEIEDIDISTHPDLEARYGGEIPVLLVDGRKAAKYRIEETALRRMLIGRTESPGTPNQNSE